MGNSVLVSSGAETGVTTLVAPRERGSYFEWLHTAVGIGFISENAAVKTYLCTKGSTAPFCQF